MKNNKLFLSILIIFIAALIILIALGYKTRIGYLTEFKFDEYHINRTLELNGLNIDEVKKTFTIDNTLNNEALINYIFTNEAITNYSYGYKVGYYSKVFKHSDLYGVYPNTNKILIDNNFLKEIKMDKPGSPFGNLISEKILKYDEKIDNINYSLLLKSRLIKYVILFYFITLLIIYYYKFIFNFFTKIDKYYIFIAFIGIILFIFQFWLLFPGFYNMPDSYYVMYEAIKNKYYNWHPAIIGITLHILYSIFGYQEYYIFLLQLFLWYFGLALLIISLYFKYNNKYVIFLFLISFLKSIFLYNIYHIKDSTATLFLFFSISLLIFMMVLKLKNNIVNYILYSIIIINIIFALLWRHNFIVTLYPIVGFIIYYLLSEKKKFNILNYSFIMLLAAIIMIGIVKIFPLLFSNVDKENVYPASHIIFLQIAGSAVISNDPNIIPSKWYLEDKNFEDLKYTYWKYRTYSDYLVAFDDKVLRYAKYKEKFELFLLLIKSIAKHPIAYIKHMMNYSITMISVPTWTLNSYEIQLKTGRKDYKDYYEIFGDDVGITFSKTRLGIYNFLYNILIDLNIFYFISISIVIFFINIFLIFIRKVQVNYFLILSFFCSCSCLVTTIIVCLFTPAVVHRYIYPVTIISIISIIALSIYIKDVNKSFFYYKK
ncbi:hypothetical protein [uncultured Brachyspira sp.]|uniref:hypothetical protein n=1 Tax=uncultured Brachyspira sp. TaxID=221953 RepID=UPI002617B797|nr:hypothetical protein [uncultured Brachyspira sp.]